MDTKDRIKSMRAATGLSQVKFGEYFGIPRRTIEQWESGNREPADYILRLIQYRLVMEGLMTKDGDPYEIE